MSKVKITILGDIMCEPRTLKAYRTGKDQYDFSGVFRNVRSLLSESDYVIGNLETPLAGEAAKYVDTLFSFNAPDSFAAAAKENGIDLLLTANNHCLDRGFNGLMRTARVLEENRIPFAGTFSDPVQRGNTYFRAGDLTAAVISYTYGTNYSANRIVLSENEKKHVNLLKPQTEPYFVSRPEKKSFSKRIRMKIANSFKGEKKFWARKLLGLPVNQAHEDDYLHEETLLPYLDQLRSDIEQAKEKADIVLFCPHIGGQFNREPGAFSKYIFDFAEMHKVDAILASHAHVVQRAEIRDGIPGFYSLGNFSMSPNSVYLLHENLPEYGIAAHLYVTEYGIEKTAFSILRIEEKEQLSVYPVDEYVKRCGEKEKEALLKDVRQICRTVTQRDLDGEVIRREYDLDPANKKRSEEGSEIS